jgi:hypothetical protein
MALDKAILIGMIAAAVAAVASVANAVIAIGVWVLVL